MATFFNKITDLNSLPLIREKHSDQKVVFMTGCYDLFHLGHSIFLNQGKSHGDILVVGVGRDSMMRVLKGESRPVIPEETRLKQVASQGDVDYCLLQKDIVTQEEINTYNSDKVDFEEILSKLKPDIFVVPESHTVGLDTKKELCEKYGISYVQVPRIIPGGTTDLINSIKLNN